MENEKRGKFGFIKKHNVFFFAILAVIIILAIIFRPTQPKTIETARVKRGDITESLSATGSIISKTSVNLNFLASGKLVYLGAKKGDHVEANQIIAILDQRTLQKNLESALRDYSLKRDTFDQTQADNGNRTPNQALNDTMRRILQDNQYNLEKAVLSVELQQLAKENSVLIAPIAGVITRADVQISGINVSSSTTFTIADPDNLVFDIDIGQADIGRIHYGEKVDINLDAFPNQTLRQSVEAIDFASHTTSTGDEAYTVEVNLPKNDELKYHAGMNGDAEIILSEKKNVLTIPNTSVQDDKYVYVQNGSIFKKRKIVLGSKSDTEAEVVSGLGMGEKVAINPNDAEKLAK